MRRPMQMLADEIDHPAPHRALSDELPSRYRLTPNIRAEAAERRRLMRDLGAATRDGMLLLQYQPRLALGSGRAAGAEAKLRWPHRKRGLVRPRDFMPLAERSGQAPSIGAWALAAACRDAAAWADPSAVSLAMPAGQIAASTLLAQIAAALECSGLAPDRLEISLAETLLQDAGADDYLMLSAIRDLGVGVAVDDFGVGVGSLAMLRRLPLTAMKLDRSLVRELPANGDDAAIVRASIHTGHALGLTLVADGVETEAQRSFLADAGCDQGQGALLGATMSAEQAAAWFGV